MSPCIYSRGLHHSTDPFGSSTFAFWAGSGMSWSDLVAILDSKIESSWNHFAPSKQYWGHLIVILNSFWTFIITTHCVRFKSRSCPKGHFRTRVMYCTSKVERLVGITGKWWEGLTLVRLAYGDGEIINRDIVSCTSWIAIGDDQRLSTNAY